MPWIDGAMPPHTTETVWNAGLAGTSVEANGKSLVVGPGEGWAPEDLLLAAAEGSFMSKLLALADEASIEVLGYVSKGALSDRRTTGGTLAIGLMPCVIVSSNTDAVSLRGLAERALRESTVARVLGEHLRVALDVRTVAAKRDR